MFVTVQAAALNARNELFYIVIRIYVRNTVSDQSRKLTFNHFVVVVAMCFDGVGVDTQANFG